MSGEIKQHQNSMSDSAGAVVSHALATIAADQSKNAESLGEQIGDQIEANAKRRNERLFKLRERVSAERARESKTSILQKKYAELGAIKNVESAKNFLKGLFADQRHSADLHSRQQGMIEEAMRAIDSGKTTAINYKEADATDLAKGLGSGVDKSVEAAVSGAYAQRDLQNSSRQIQNSQEQGALSKQQAQTKKQISALKKMRIIKTVIKVVQISMYIAQAAATIATGGLAAGTLAATQALGNLASTGAQKIAATVAQTVAKNVAQKAVQQGVQSGFKQGFVKAVNVASAKVVPAVMQGGQMLNGHYAKNEAQAQTAAQGAQKTYGEMQQAHAELNALDQKNLAKAQENADKILDLGRQV